MGRRPESHAMMEVGEPGEASRLKWGVRVRGIYATALARLLIDNGIKVVDASPQLKARFGDAVEERGVALATVKDRDDRRGLVAVGRRDLLQRVIEVLRSVVRESPIIVMKEEIYATYVCKVVEAGVVELPGMRRGFLEGNAKVGEFVVAHVVTFREGVPVMRPGVALVGEFARLVEGSSHEVSEHVRGPRRSLLLSLAMKAGIEGWGVKWRSSARWAEIGELLSELQALKERIPEVKELAKKVSPPAKLTDGDVLALIPLSLSDKARLDELRSRQVPTIPLHHMLKACGEKYSKLVDDAETVFFNHCPPVLLSKALLRELEHEYGGGELRLMHEKLDGAVVTIEGDYEVLAREPLTLKMVRRVQKPGVYNGLKLPKEVGDTIVSIVTVGSRVLPHAYFASDGRLKGVYVNINTPIEPSPPHSFWYLDLCTDVVWTMERGPEVIDVEELLRYQEYFAEGTLDLYKSLARDVAKRLEELEGKLADDPLNALIELSRAYVSESITQLLERDETDASFILPGHCRS